MWQGHNFELLLAPVTSTDYGDLVHQLASLQICRQAERHIQRPVGIGAIQGVEISFHIGEGDLHMEPLLMKLITKITSNLF